MQDTDEGTLHRTLAPRTKELDKRSLDYVLRSGLAGGLAGCAVRRTEGTSHEDNLLTCLAG
jgi:hypothetical protein